MATTLSDSDLSSIYAWVDTLELSRPRRRINRDFSDAVLCAEVVAHYFPRLVQMHNYPAANAVQQKLVNWEHLAAHALADLRIQVTPALLHDLANSVPGAIEKVLYLIQQAVSEDSQRARSFLVRTPDIRTRSQDLSKTVNALITRPPAPAASPEVENTLNEALERARAAEERCERLVELCALKDTRIAALEHALLELHGERCE